MQVSNHSTYQVMPYFLGYVWILAGPSVYQVLQQGPSPSYTFTTPPPLVSGLQLIVRVALQGDGVNCPNDTSKSDRVFIYLDTLPPVPVLSGPDHICFSQFPNTFQVQNHNVISGHPGFVGYTWELNGSTLGSTGTSPTYFFGHPFPAGQHTIKVYAIFNSLCTNYTTDQVALQVDTFLTPIDMLPSPTLVSDQPLPFCYTYPPSVTVSVSNDAIIQGNPDFIGYSWKVNGVYQVGVSGSSLTINAPQVDMTVQAWAIYRNLCGKDSLSGRPIHLTLFNPTFPAPFLGETFPYCQPDSIVLQVYNHAAVSSSPGFQGYLWFMNNQFVGASAGPAYTVNNPPVGANLIQAYAVFQHTCGTDTTYGIGYVYIGQPPQVTPSLNGIPYSSGDTISLVGPLQATFSASSTIQGNGYHWSLWLPGNNTVQTNQNHTGTPFITILDSAGVYRIILQSSNYAACVQLDTVYVKLSKSASSLQGKTLQTTLFPNPTAGPFTVAVPDPGAYRVLIMDGYGRRVYEGEFSGMEQTFAPALPAGVYQLIISGEGGVATHRLVVRE